MPIVNYVREHIRFMEYATDEHLTSSERLLWYALMHIMNQRAQGKVWPDEFIRISNERLLSFCPMKFDSMAKARNALKQRGLIEFTKGEKNKLSPSYRMIYFFPQYVAPDTESAGDESNTELSDNHGYNRGGNLGYNHGYNRGGNDGDNVGDIYINNKRIQEQERIPPLVYPRHSGEFEDEEDDDEEFRAYARAREEAVSAWRESFGRDATPAALNRIARCVVTYGMQPGVVSAAVNIAAGREADSPVDYVARVLCDWNKHNVKTPEDVDEYMPMFDASQGKLLHLGIYPSDALEDIKNFAEDRETAAQRASRLQREQKAAEEMDQRRAEIRMNTEEREKLEYARERERLDRKYGVSL